MNHILMILLIQSYSNKCQLIRPSHNTEGFVAGSSGFAVLPPLPAAKRRLPGDVTRHARGSLARGRGGQRTLLKLRVGPQLKYQASKITDKGIRFAVSS